MSNRVSRRSTIHLRSRVVALLQPSFAQVFDNRTRANATSASQLPVLNAKSGSCSATIAAGIVDTHFKNGGFTCCDELRSCL